MIDPSSDAGRVNAMDMVFSISSFLFALVAYTQTFMYVSDPSLRSTRVVVSMITVFFIAATLIEYLIGVRFESYCGFSLILFAAFIKAGSSLVKYLY